MRLSYRKKKRIYSIYKALRYFEWVILVLKWGLSPPHPQTR
jgi:hypothetical protein